MNTFFIIDKFTDAHKWTQQLLEKLPPYKFQAEFHAPDGRLTLRCIRNAPKFHCSLLSHSFVHFFVHSHSKQHGRRNETGKETLME